MAYFRDNYVDGACVYDLEVTEHGDFGRKFMNPMTGEFYYIDQLCIVNDKPVRCVYCKSKVDDRMINCSQCGGAI